MRRLFVALLFSLLFYTPVHAQTEVECEIPDVTVTVKRCFRKAGLVYVDILFQNTGASDRLLNLYQPSVLDDEGVTYDAGNRKAYWVNSNRIDPYRCLVPSQVEKRCRIVVKDLDEFATVFQLVDIRADWESYRSVMTITQLRIRNVPIPEDE